MLPKHAEYQAFLRPACEPLGTLCSWWTPCDVGQRTTLFETMKSAAAGVEPALPPWQGDRLPLHHGAIQSVPIVKEPRAPGGTRTLVTALRVRYPRRWTTSAFVSVGPEGLEPSLGGLRVRCAAANTLIPFSASLRREWARRESNPRSDPYKRPALTVELPATGSGAERT